MAETSKDFLTAKDVARRTGRSLRWVQYRIQDGTLPTMKIAGARLVPLEGYRRAFGLADDAAVEPSNG